MYEDTAVPTDNLNQRWSHGIWVGEAPMTVKSFPPTTEISMQYGYDENNNNMSSETKRETKNSTTKWNDVNTHNYMQLTKYNKYTNDDVYTCLLGAHDTLSSHIARTLVQSGCRLTPHWLKI